MRTRLGSRGQALVLCVGLALAGSALWWWKGAAPVLVAVLALQGALFALLVHQLRATRTVERRLRAGAKAGHAQIDKRLAKTDTLVRDVATAVGTARSEVTARQRKLDKSLSSLTRAPGKKMSPLERRLRSAQQADIRQLEALLNLHALVRVRRRMPPTRRWAASPDVLLDLVSWVLTHRPRTVVECGSGASTLWLGYALEQVGEGGRVVALEHEKRFGDAVMAQLREHGLEEQATVRVSPLQPVELGGESFEWYDVNSLRDVERCELVFVDGPPGEIAPLARYPALPLLGDRMPPGACIVLDDADRPEEQQVLDRWAKEFPGFHREDLAYEKGAARLIRAADDEPRPPRGR